MLDLEYLLVVTELLRGVDTEESVGDFPVPQFDSDKGGKGLFGGVHSELFNGAFDFGEHL